MNSSDIQRKRKIAETDDKSGKRSRVEANGPQKSLPQKVSDLWVDKYTPESTKQVIGQQGDRSCVNKLLKWLSNWHKNLDKKPGFGKFATEDGQGFRAALLSGPPGVGKTTSAHLVCKELAYDWVELNASDSRSKKTLEVVVKELLQNTTLTDFFNTASAKTSVTAKHVVIMDEVDGMAGNEDRGGVAELIQLIKGSKVPIICICNDRSHPKMRSLVNYCFDLRFSRPRVEQIKGPMMSIAFKEGIQISPNVLHELIVSANQDIRQILHNLSLLGTGAKKINNLLSDQSIKDVRLSTFDAVRKVYSSGEEYQKMSFGDKSDLFFCDYSIMPLFNFENYPLVNPSKARNETQRLKCATKAIEAMAFGDLIEKQIRGTNNWSLLPLQAAFASVMPGAYMNGHFGGQIQFPSFMGKMSTTNKKNRLLQELKMHMNLKVSGSKTALNLDYLEPLRDAIIEPLVANGQGGIPNTIETLENYCLRREDLESIIELTLWNHQKDPMSRVDSKVKAALTRAYNKEGFCLPYSLGTITKGKKGKSAVDLNDVEGEDGDNGSDIEDNEEVDDIAIDAMIKAKKTKATKKSVEKESKTKAKTNKSKKSESEKEKKPKKQIKVRLESDSECEPIISPKKASKKEIKNEKKSEQTNGTNGTTKPRRESPKKSPQKAAKSGDKTKKIVAKSPPKESEVRRSPRKSSKPETKSESKSTPKKAAKSPTKSEQTNGQKSKTKSEPKSETKSESKPRKTPETKTSKTNSASKGKQLTISSFFTKK
ncbi:unnamed protein product [Oppiella nova]|uniref:Activator 1 large subunit n=1 Tax=Oppiella nova TaxID=334625 RepID=A0A7R9QDX4_9ACAR|nr:unnamed protein product [Oppiella nova]CAG2163081.1 unnamed protein product [Oppiella nova]